VPQLPEERVHAVSVDICSELLEHADPPADVVCTQPVPLLSQTQVVDMPLSAPADLIAGTATSAGGVSSQTDQSPSAQLDGAEDFTLLHRTVGRKHSLSRPVALDEEDAETQMPPETEAMEAAKTTEEEAHNHVATQKLAGGDGRAQNAPHDTVRRLRKGGTEAEAVVASSGAQKLAAFAFRRKK